jgi:hypothetical protein
MTDSAAILKEVFSHALECASPAERDRYLTEACAGNAVLRAEVEALLQAHASLTSFLERPAVDDVLPEANLARRSGDATAEQESRDQELSLDFLSPSQKAGSLGRLDHYEVCEVIGRGGMGVVLKAFDEKLHRVVAVKVMAPELAASPQGRRRFVREAQAAAAVRHEHVIDIHAVEVAGPLPYLVMECIVGVSLEDRIRRNGSLRLKEVLRIGMQIAQGLAAAHAQGLVHRNIKPANILLENGIERVKITDFGLARPVEDDSVTLPGMIAGTPQFMAPEQAAAGPVDRRADLFSLGSVLYMMCAGQPPFAAGNAFAVLKRVCEETPWPVRELNPEVPDWLAAIIERLYAKDPANRFQSAAEVAERLANGLAHVQEPSAVPAPKLAARAGVVFGTRRRHWLIAAAAVLLLAGAVLAPLYLFGWIGARNQHGGQNGPEPSVQLRLRTTLRGYTGTVHWVVFHPHEKMLASAGAEGDTTLKLWDLATEKVLDTLEGHTGQITHVAFSPDGKTLASSSWDGTARLWQLESRTEIAKLERPSIAWTVVFSPDGKTLATSYDETTLKWWDVATQEERAQLEVGGSVRSLAYSPDGKTLAVLIGWKTERDVQLWDVATKQRRAAPLAHFDGANGAAFTSDSRILETGSLDRTVKLWDVTKGTELASLYGPPGWSMTWPFLPMTSFWRAATASGNERTNPAK